MITPDLLHELVVLAGRAPSLHNTQPWRFGLDNGAVELRIDPARVVPHADPRARETVIGCGAALYTLRLALRGHGLVPSVDLTPASGDPLLLARVTAEPGPEATQDERRLLGVVVRRHTQRHGFTGDPLSPPLISAMARDAAAEGSTLVWVEEPASVSAVAGISLLAERMRATNPRWRAEVARWVDHDGDRPDGIPARSMPSPGAVETLDRLPVAQFVPRHLVGQGHPRLGSPGRIAVLTTPSDIVLDWVAAGQSLQRLLLRAADDWAFAAYNTAPLENPYLREEIRDALGLRDHPQMLFEVGHVAVARSTPRLSPAETVDLRQD